MKKNFFKNSFGNEILFSKKEYLDRVKKVKLKMSKNNIDVLLVASPANQFYLTGYDCWSFYTPQMVLISLSEKYPYWIGRKMDAVGAKFTAFLDKDNIVPYPDHYVASQKIHPMDYLVDFIKSKIESKKQGNILPNEKTLNDLKKREEVINDVLLNSVENYSSLLI